MGYGKEKTRMSSEPPARGAGGTTVLSLSWAALLGGGVGEDPEFRNVESRV